MFFFIFLKISVKKSSAKVRKTFIFLHSKAKNVGLIVFFAETTQADFSIFAKKCFHFIGDSTELLNKRKFYLLHHQS